MMMIINDVSLCNQLMLLTELHSTELIKLDDDDDDGHALMAS
jgi:hypothetical protein